MAPSKRKIDDTTGADRKRNKLLNGSLSETPSSGAEDFEDQSDSPSSAESFLGFSDSEDLNAPKFKNDNSKGHSGSPSKKKKDFGTAHKAPQNWNSERYTKLMTDNFTSSKEAHAKQKAMVQERKAAKPHADLIKRSKIIWEKLRRKSHTPREERQKLVAELFTIIDGRVKDLVFKHDAGRSIQCAIKYANFEQRRSIAYELKGSYVELAKGKYSKHFIDKLLSHGDKEIRDLIVPEFYGKVLALLRHNEASWVVDDIYRAVATKEQKAILLREWYSAQFAHEDGNSSESLTSDLKTILSQFPDQRPAIMRRLLEAINRMIQTHRTSFVFLHDAMLEYFMNLRDQSTEQRDFVELVRGNDDESRTLIRALAFTRSGAQVLCYTLAHGTAKDRKILLRAFRSVEGEATGSLFPELAVDKNGYLVLMATFDTVDDTVQIPKMIFSDLFGKDAENQTERMIELVLHPIGRLIVLDLLAPLPVEENGQPESAFANPADALILREVALRRVETSKKDPETRKSELRRLISTLCLTSIQGGAKDLVNAVGGKGTKFISDSLFHGVGDKEGAMEAVAEAVEGDPQSEGYVGGNQVSTGKMLKALVIGSRFDKNTKEMKGCDAPLKFANILFPHIRPYLVEWATSMSSFVVVNMMQSDEFTQKTKARQTLEKAKDKLEDARQKNNTGAKMLLAML